MSNICSCSRVLSVAVLGAPAPPDAVEKEGVEVVARGGGTGFSNSGCPRKPALCDCDCCDCEVAEPAEAVCTEVADDLLLLVTLDALAPPPPAAAAVLTSDPTDSTDSPVSSRSLCSLVTTFEVEFEVEFKVVVVNANSVVVLDTPFDPLVEFILLFPVDPWIVDLIGIGDLTGIGTEPQSEPPKIRTRKDPRTLAITPNASLRSLSKERGWVSIW
jgi:hypothetical protein